MSLVREHQCPLCHLKLYIDTEGLDGYCCIEHKRRMQARGRGPLPSRALKTCSVCFKTYDAGPPSKSARRQTCSVVCQRRLQSMDMRMVK